MGSKFELYEDAVGEHRWRVTASNGEIIGASTEGYAERGDAVRNALLLGVAICGMYVEERLP